MSDLMGNVSGIAVRPRWAGAPLASQMKTTAERVNVGARAMLLHEELARSRMRETEESARRWRLAHRLVTIRRWERLARYAAARAERARSV